MSFSEWKKYKLGEDVVTKVGDGLHGTPIYDDNGEYYFINGSNLVDGKVVININTKKVNEEQFIKYKKDLSERTILLGINGTIGNVALYNNEMCILGKSAAYLNVNDDFDKHFIRYVLANDHFQSYIKNNASGTTIKNVGLGLLREYEFSAPQKTTQTKIANMLSSIDEKIELNRQTNQTLETVAQTLFKEWFINEIDKNCETISFGELVKPKRGKNITKTQAIPGVYPVVAGGLEPSCYHNKANTSSPVVTISSSGANAGFVRLYQNQVWAADCSYIDRTITPYVLFSYVFLKINQHIIFDKQVGSAQPHIYPSHIMEMVILNYPPTLIDKFEKLVEPIFLNIKHNEQENQSLLAVQDSLLPKLMKGEIDI